MLPFKFQFHKGTIRTQGLEYDNQAKKNFNSIKVQLEHSDSFILSRINEYFNSIKVQLEHLTSYGAGHPIRISIP